MNETEFRSDYSSNDENFLYYIPDDNNEKNWKKYEGMKAHRTNNYNKNINKSNNNKNNKKDYHNKELDNDKILLTEQMHKQDKTMSSDRSISQNSKNHKLVHFRENNNKNVNNDSDVNNKNFNNLT